MGRNDIRNENKPITYDCTCVSSNKNHYIIPSPNNL